MHGRGLGISIGCSDLHGRARTSSDTPAGVSLDGRTTDRSVATSQLLNANATAWLSSLLKSPPDGKAKGAPAKANGVENGVGSSPARSMTNLYGAASSSEAVRRSHARPASVPLGLSSAQSITRLI